MIVRAITEAAECPRLRVDGAARTMFVRAPADPPDFPVLTCERKVSHRADGIELAGRTLQPRSRRPRRIAVLGDTGCRLATPSHYQACNDPGEWPFAQVAKSIARWDPDVILHVGDYLYREAPCPGGNSGCAGSPYGDNWPAWNADFFTPARRALRAAPWLFVRGNHELCSRGGQGWFRFLDPRPVPESCQDVTPPYAVTVGRTRMVNFDTSNASDFSPFNPEPYEPMFADLGRMIGERGWLLTHRPIWALASINNGANVAVTNTTLQLASNNELPPRVRLVLSGHLHNYEVFGYGRARAPQLVAGNGGTEMDAKIATPIEGMTIAGAKLVDAATDSRFGFFTFVRRPRGWTAAIRDVGGRVVSRCRLVRRGAGCGA
jgi:hypothetical protein